VLLKPIIFSTLIGILSGLLLVSCGFDKSNREWRRISDNNLIGGGGVSQKILEQIETNEFSSEDNSPEFEIINWHCYSNDEIERSSSMFHTNTTLYKLINDFTQSELQEMMFVMDREMTVIKNKSQRIKYNFKYVVPLSIYLMIQEVVGPEQMDSEDVKKLFYMVGIPIPEALLCMLIGQSRALSLSQENYKYNWVNSRRYFDQIEDTDIHERLMREVRTEEALMAELAGMGLYPDEIEFLLSYIILNEALYPKSREYKVDYIAENCNYYTSGMPWFPPGPDDLDTTCKDPDKITDLYYQKIQWWIIFVDKFYCPTPTPTPPDFIPLLPGGGDSISVPCPTPGPLIDIPPGETIDIPPGGTVDLLPGGTIDLLPGGTIIILTGGTVTLPTGGTVIDPTGEATIISIGGTAIIPTGGIVTLPTGGAVIVSTGGMVTLPTGGIVDGAPAATPPPSLIGLGVATPTPTPDVITYGGCGACDHLLEFPNHITPFNVCLQNIRNDNRGVWFGAPLNLSLLSSANGAYYVSWADPSSGGDNSLNKINCCTSALSRTDFNGNDVYELYTSTMEDENIGDGYHICDDFNHVFVGNGTNVPSAVLQATGNTFTNPIDVRDIGNVSAVEWFTFVQANPITCTSQ
jgi:hypothetical protein